MGLVLIGLNHETASLDARERVVYTADDAVAALRTLKESQRVAQAFLLSTCNRTELYALMPDPDADIPRVKEALFYPRLSRENGSGDHLLYSRSDAAAVQHLFRVSCGLDSMVLGEQEILGQVKTAYEISRRAETVGTIFHRLAHQAFRVGKRARTETQIGYGAVSVAYAAVELAEKVFQSLRGRGALLVGAGENGELCARHLLSRGVNPFFIANRTLERAECLARDLGGDTVSLDRMGEAMAQVDIVVTTTGATGAIIDEDMVRGIMDEREGRALVFVDIAVPRDVDPEVDRVPNVFRFDMEALKDIVDRTVQRRMKEVPVVERLVASEVEGFMKWWESLASGPVIRDLHEAFEAVRAREHKKNVKRFGDEDREQLEIFSRNLMRKLLMEPTLEIKRFRTDDPVDTEQLAAIRRVFRLDERVEDDVEPDSF
jgi:glutamyl-tRNA reductase